MNRDFDAVTDSIMEKLEEYARVEAPIREYLDALIAAKDQIDTWFEMSIDAARDDVRRQGE